MKAKVWILTVVGIITFNGCSKNGLELRQEADILVQSKNPKQQQQGLYLYVEAAQKGDPKGQYIVGAISYGKKAYKKAYKQLLKSANQGYPDAKVLLGRMYQEGQGVEKDYKKAYVLFKEAAEDGHINGINNIAWMCISQGYGMQDHNEAEKWYLKSAEKGDALAQYQLGWLYNSRQNYAEALKWYRKAADQKYINAQVSLGDMYKNGRGVEQDYKKAYQLYKSAADKGNNGALKRLNKLCQHASWVCE